METVSRQEILVAYLCVIGTVALVFWWSRTASGRDDCGPPRGGSSLPEQPAPPPRAKRAPAPSSRGAHVRGALLMRDLPAPEARAAHGMREPAFSRSDPILGMQAGASSARRGAHVRGASLVQSAPSHLPQKHKATIPESTLGVEMNGLEEQADNPKAGDIYWKLLSSVARDPSTHEHQTALTCLSGRHSSPQHLVWNFPCFPFSPSTITARLLSAAAKITQWTLTAITQARSATKV